MDVKLWLSELRGGDMPESFAWSYKRKYRAGYVWQDLMDDDLITPISDNEYMLKGSLLPLKNKTTEDLFYLNEQSTQSKEQYPEEDIEDGCTTNMHKTKHETLQIDNTISPKPPSDADQESPVMGTSPSRPDCRTRQTAVFKIDSWREEMKRAEQQRCNEIVVRRKGNRTKGAGCSKVGGDPPSHRRAFKILRNLLKCRRVDIKESALRDTREQDGMIPQSNHRNGGNNSDRKSRERKGSDGWRKEGERASSAMYKPVAEPNCSQCGRPFKPEKLHSHMRSCKALKEKARSRNFNREKVTEQSELASKPGVPKVTVTAL
ncbi:hypothetical protein HPP92_020364 [Vanilla planifolia]|uniref:SOSEKI DIX-like domain-containing protein n=1 Tax=Vanilla planifolia TaxID=51239 RepID=A0A835Q4Y1_VANPL|nr:hypothetical protein HPP92_020364 [Vanilla planifolia]